MQDVQLLVLKPHMGLQGEGDQFLLTHDLSDRKWKNLKLLQLVGHFFLNIPQVIFVLIEHFYLSGFRNLNPMKSERRVVQLNDKPYQLHLIL